MNPFSDPLDDMLDLECGSCKGRFWVPYYEDLPDVSFPSYCPFCGKEFDMMIDVGEE